MGATRSRHFRGALVLAGLGVLVVAQTSAASGPPDRIAFSRLLDGGGAAIRTYRFSADGSGAALAADEALVLFDVTPP